MNNLPEKALPLDYAVPANQKRRGWLVLLIAGLVVLLLGMFMMFAFVRESRPIPMAPTALPVTVKPAGGAGQQ